VPKQQDWRAHFEREQARYRDGEQRLAAKDNENADLAGAAGEDQADPDSRQRQLTRMANAAAGAGLASLMAGDEAEARSWLTRAAERYLESFAEAPPGSWGRPIGAMKARVIAGDWAGAAKDARWALDAGAADSDSPIGRYAAALAFLVRDDDEAARENADFIRTRDDFPRDVGDALAFVAAHDVIGYTEAVESVLESFERRGEYLEDIPVADTVIVLQALAGRRRIAAPLDSPLLPIPGPETEPGA
jgi:hypothetical protein